MILITRPEEDAKQLAAALEEKNIPCFIEPMISISYLTPSFKSSNPVQAFITTSKHARKALPSDAKHIGIPEKGKNASELLKWIFANIKNNDGPLVYLRGNKISFDLASELRLQNYEVTEAIVYNATPPADFTSTLLANFHKLTAASFFSAETLKTFLKLVIKNNLQEKLQNIALICLSKEIAEHGKSCKWKNIHVSTEPNLNSMIEKINEVY